MLTNPVNRFRKVREDLLRGLIYELVKGRIKPASGDARAQWIDRAVDARTPAFRQPEREDEDVQLFEHFAHPRKMLTAIGIVLGP